MLTSTPRAEPALAPYIRIARADHWVKNVFMLPGVAIGLLFARPPVGVLLWHFAVGLTSLCLVASANYTINEFLDAEFDRFRPVKKNRAGALGQLDGRYVILQYSLLIAAGMALAAQVDVSFAAVSLMLLCMGVIYNVKPLRTKDRPYLDVL